MKPILYWRLIMVCIFSSLFIVQYALCCPEPPPPDTDQDGLPDVWENQHFGNLGQNGSGDFDNDGLTNLQEYQMGTNPANPFSDGKLHVFTPLKK